MLRFIPPFRSGHPKAKRAQEPTPLPAFRTAFHILTPATQAERDSVPAAAHRLLRQAVSFNGDGHATALSLLGGRTHIQWKNLAIHRVADATLTEADRLAGISRRCYVHLTSEAHRRWVPRHRYWTPWEINGYTLFPSVIVVERIHGTYTARAQGIENFTPAQETPDPSVEMSVAV